MLLLDWKLLVSLLEYFSASSLTRVLLWCANFAVQHINTQKSDHHNINIWLIDFSSLSTSRGSFHAERLGNSIHCMYTFDLYFVCCCFLKVFFLRTVLSNENNL